MRKKNNKNDWNVLKNRIKFTSYVTTNVSRITGPVLRRSKIHFNFFLYSWRANGNTTSSRCTKSQHINNLAERIRIAYTYLSLFKYTRIQPWIVTSTFVQFTCTHIHMYSKPCAETVPYRDTVGSAMVSLCMCHRYVQVSRYVWRYLSTTDGCTMIDECV